MKEGKIGIFGFLVVWVLMAGCQVNGQEKNCEVGTGKIKELASKQVVIIDVRTPEEFREGHLPGAKLINVNDADFLTQIDKLEKDQQYIVYCRSGRRSARAQEIMMERGFRNVCNVPGGVLKMKAESIELVKENN